MKDSKLEQHAEQAAELLKSMSNKNRLMVLCNLADREMSVSELNQCVPLSQSALSQHLAYLRNSDLVSTRKEAQTVYYSLNGKAAIQIISVLKRIYCPKI